MQHHDDNTKVFLDVQTMCIQDDNSVKSKIGSGPVLADDFKKTQWSTQPMKSHVGFNLANQLTSAL